MKGNVLKLRKGHALCMALLAIAAAGTLLLKAPLWAQEDPVDPCHFEGRHVGWFASLGTFSLASTEDIEAIVGESSLDREGKAVKPIQIRGMAGRGRATGIGETVYWLDTSRPVASGIRAKLRGQEFPAVHEMGFHLFLTTEALPGQIFRSINPAVMVNNNSMSFPPKPGSRYVLKNVVEFEDVNDPGFVVARIVSNHNQYLGSGRLGISRRHEN
ncbi:MAG TPA: hypothetical protein VKK31_06080 [Thermoanaerobaculia bacterium]|nr:hypothetical protein [Thermoanaerobaculia bacterium]